MASPVRLIASSALPALARHAPLRARREAARITLGPPREAATEAGLAPVLWSGLADLDAWLGGIPRGRITELVGGASCGKTAVLLGTLERALALERAQPVALIDMTRSVFPAGEWALQRLLVVRPKSVELGLRALDLLLDDAAFAAIGLVVPHGARELMESARVRTARLVREAGTAVIACSERAVFGASACVRLDLQADRAGTLSVRALKSRAHIDGPLSMLRPGWPTSLPFHPGDARDKAAGSSRAC